MRSHFQETSKTAILEKTKKKKNTTTTIVARKTTTGNRKKTTAETAPSCNDCVATIFTEPFTLTAKGGRTVNSAFRRGNKSVISPDSGIRRGLETEVKLFIRTFSFLVMS